MQLKKLDQKPQELRAAVTASGLGGVLLIHFVSKTEGGRAFDVYQSYVRSDVVTISVDAQVNSTPGAPVI